MRGAPDRERSASVSEAGDCDVPVKAKAVLIDPQSMTVVWANEAASEGDAGEAHGALAGLSVDRIVPMAEALGLPEALRAVAETGVARHLRADLVSMARGSVAMVVSVYRLPDGTLLVLIENAWQMGERKARPRQGSR
jgi:hypothetical protein